MALIIDPSTPITLANAVGDILSALVDAQAQAARTTVDFINAVGFLPAQPGKPPALRNIQFSFNKLDENQAPAQFTVEIPLLGMVDIPLICIRRATLTMDYEVTSVEEVDGKTPSGSNKKVPQLKGRILSGRTSSSSERGAVKVTVEVEKAEPPPGLARALDILELAARETKQP
jgi:hypothetical protein